MRVLDYLWCWQQPFTGTDEVLGTYIGATVTREEGKRAVLYFVRLDSLVGLMLTGKSRLLSLAPFLARCRFRFGVHLRSFPRRCRPSLHDSVELWYVVGYWLLLHAASALMFHQNAIRPRELTVLCHLRRAAHMRPLTFTVQPWWFQLWYIIPVFFKKILSHTAALQL